MPFYEYECTKCNHTTEVFQKISDPPITECERCSGKMKKLISRSTFHLKGTGWYVTDYASKTGGYDGKTGSGENKGADAPAKEAKGSSEKPKKEPSSTGKKSGAKDAE